MERWLINIGVQNWFLHCIETLRIYITLMAHNNIVIVNTALIVWPEMAQELRKKHNSNKSWERSTLEQATRPDWVPSQCKRQVGSGNLRNQLVTSSRYLLLASWFRKQLSANQIAEVARRNPSDYTLWNPWRTRPK